MFHCHDVSVSESTITTHLSGLCGMGIWHMRYTNYRWLSCPLHSLSPQLMHKQQHILPLYVAYHHKNEVFAKHGWLSSWSSALLYWCIVVLNAYYLWVLFCHSSMLHILTLLLFWSISIALQVAEFGWRYSGVIVPHGSRSDELWWFGRWWFGRRWWWWWLTLMLLICKSLSISEYCTS